MDTDTIDLDLDTVAALLAHTSATCEELAALVDGAECVDGCYVPPDAPWLADDGNAQADALWNEMRPWNDVWWSHVHATKCADVERWLIEYAHKHGCAVEVTS